MNKTTAAKAVGWISIGIGTAELLAPGWLAQRIGPQGYKRLMHIFNVPELLAGTGIGNTPVAPSAWSRMASEAIDLVSIANSAQKRMQEGGVGTALLSLAALTALDALVASGRQERRESREAAREPGTAERKAGVRKAASATRQAGRKTAAGKPPRTH